MITTSWAGKDKSRVHACIAACGFNGAWDIKRNSSNFLRDQLPLLKRILASCFPFFAVQDVCGSKAEDASEGLPENNIDKLNEQTHVSSQAALLAKTWVLWNVVPTLRTLLPGDTIGVSTMKIFRSCGKHPLLPFPGAQSTGNSGSDLRAPLINNPRPLTLESLVPALEYQEVFVSISLVQ